MSYDIYIGNAEARFLDDESDKPEVFVPAHAEPDAPSFPYDRLTGNGNSRHPGYSQWDDFVRSVGLHDMFFDPFNGLMREHPGCFRLAATHHEQVQDALRDHRKLHPKAIPGWDFNPKAHHSSETDDGVRGKDPVLARLMWLEYWIGWALLNCERPAIYNQ